MHGPHAQVCVHFADKVLMQPPPVSTKPDEAQQGQGHGQQGTIGAQYGAYHAWPLQPFLQQWRAAVPAPFAAEVELLKGEVLVDGESASQRAAWHLPWAAFG